MTRHRDIRAGDHGDLARMSPSWDDAERAILVALLRTRPQGWRWPEITAEVAQTGSARELWSRLVPSDLFGQIPDDHPGIPQPAPTSRAGAAGPVV